MNPPIGSSPIEVFIEAGNTLGEGPIWWRKRDLLVWVDILECKIFAADGSGTIVHVYEMREPVGCVFEMNDGSLVAGCQSGLRSVPNGELIARIPDASPNIRINDGKVDPWGNLVFGTMGFPEPRDGAGTLWRWDGQQFSALKDSVTIPNGMVWRPDQSSLLFIDTPTQSVGTYRYGPKTDRLGEPLSSIDLSRFNGDPDGMCEGPNGDLFIAMWDGFGFLQIGEDKEIRAHSLPLRRPTSFCFVPKLSKMFITSAKDDLSGELGTVMTFDTEKGKQRR